MSTKKKGILTVSKEWAKHLRPFGKRDFWKRERKAGSEHAAHILQRDDYAVPAMERGTQTGGERTGEK